MIDTGYILAQVEECILAYEEGYKTLGIDDLLNFRDKTSILAYRLAEQVADFKAEYNRSYFIRKITISKTKQGLISGKKYAVSKAQIEADVLHEEELKTEINNESAAFRADLLLRQLNKILESVSQRISWLKTEKPLAERQQI